MIKRIRPLHTALRKKLRPYFHSPAGSRWRKYEKTCPNCQARLEMHTNHQRIWESSVFPSKLWEYNKTVYLECGACGELIKTRLTPAGRYMNEELAMNLGYLPKKVPDQ